MKKQTRITKLTPAQSRRFSEWINKWVAVGLSCDPANFDDAERGVRGCYRAAKLPEPKVVLRLSSPFAAVVGGPLATMMMNGVYSQVYSQVDSQVRSQVGSQVDSQVGSAWTLYRGGNLWAHWHAYVSFFRDVCAWDNPCLIDFSHEELHALSAGWCWYGTHVASISDRPSELHRDADGRLHNERGPAMLWRDGWALWRLDGIAVDEQIIMRPETQSLTQINNEKNADVRSIRIARFGWPRYLNESGAKPIHESSNDVTGCPEALFQSPSGEKRLVVVCPTGRTFAMGVSPEVQTCEQAQRWLGPSKGSCLAAT